MSYAWQTVESAAVTLQCSTRTINRRIKDNSIESRLENGRREVLVSLPDAGLDETPVESTDAATGEIVGAAPAYDDSTPLPMDADSQEALALADEKVRRAEIAVAAFRQTVTIYQTEASRARTGARFAWAAVAMLGVGSYVAVAWTTAQVTRARADAEHLSADVRSLNQLADTRQAEVDRLRTQSADAQQAKARAEGELAAAKAATATRWAAGRPQSLLQRLASLAMAD